MEKTQHIKLYRGPIQDWEKSSWDGAFRVLNVLGRIFPNQTVYRADLQIQDQPRGQLPTVFAYSVFAYCQIDTVVKTMKELDGRNYDTLSISIEDSFWEPRDVGPRPLRLDNIEMLYDVFGRANNTEVVWDPQTKGMLKERRAQS